MRRTTLPRVYPQQDYAEDWSKSPITEVHPLGTKISEAEFRTLVMAAHGLS